MISLENKAEKENKDHMTEFLEFFYRKLNEEEKKKE
jgi:hypothetical protein